MGIKQLYNDSLQKLPNEYGDVSVMRIIWFDPIKGSQFMNKKIMSKNNEMKIIKKARCCARIF